MDKKLIRDKYKSKIKLVNKHNKFYYEKNKSVISDAEYDKIKNEILLLEKKYQFLKSSNSPSKIIGHKPSKNFKKDLHKVPMLSLANAFTEEDLINFEKKF